MFDFIPNIPVALQVILSAGVILLGYGYISGQKHLGSDKASQESNTILRSLNDDLKTELAARQTQHLQEVEQMKTTYQTQIDSLQKQITALQSQVSSLQEANQVLQNTVTGKDLLAKLQSSIDMFQPYVAALNVFLKNDEEILARLDTLLQNGQP